MADRSPSQLVDEQAQFKKSGEFDKLRRDLLHQFQLTAQKSALLSNVEQIARARLDTDPVLKTKSRDLIYLELAHEIDRFPLVETAVNDFDYLASPEWIAQLETALKATFDGAVRRRETHPEESAEPSEKKERATPEGVE